jgi:hypothetical protein
MTPPHHTPTQIPLPIVDVPVEKLDRRRQQEILSVLAELLLLAVRPLPASDSEHREVSDEAR